MRLSLLLPLAALAACGAPSEPAANDAVAVEANDSVTPSTTNEAEPDAISNNAMPPFAEVSGAHPTAPEPAPIPAKFRGTWAENEAACADLKHHSRLGVSGRTVRHPDFVIFGDRFTFPSPNQFALEGHIEATGARADAHYSINAAGNVLTDEAGGGAVRVRCG
jgi:hypothetical protein